MNKGEMKRLGDYIREVDVRNRDLEVTKLVGLTIDKSFIPSVANVIGTDLSKYKIIRKEQFACSLMQVSRDGKVPIAMLEEREAIMSPAYPVFEVLDTTKLLPQYLMMWFSRKEFDREASFYAVGGVRGSLTWEDFCDMTLPIPPIEQQQKIVSEYEAVTRRIRLNEQIITKLEETVQTLYRKMFVDGIDKEHLPEGWRIGHLTDIAEYLNGVACQTYPAKVHSIPVLKIRELSQGYCDDNSDRASCIPEKFIIKGGEIIFSWSATLLIEIWYGEACALNQHLFKVVSLGYPKWFVFLSTQRHIQTWKNLISAKATSMGHIKREDLENALVFLPPSKLLIEQDKMFSCLFDYHFRLRRENLKLIELQSLLLAKMGQK